MLKYLFVSETIDLNDNEKTGISVNVGQNEISDHPPPFFFTEKNTLSLLLL